MRDLSDLRAVEPAKRQSLEWPADVRLSLDMHAPRPSMGGGLLSTPAKLLSALTPARKMSIAKVQAPAESAAGGGGGEAPPGSPRTAGRFSTSRKGGGGHKSSRLSLEDGTVFSADVLVDATGARCELFRDIGFEQVTALKSQRALGVVCHFHNHKTAEENALAEGNWAQQYNTARFKRLKEEEGVDLQNIVYYRSTGARRHRHHAAATTPLPLPPRHCHCHHATAAATTPKQRWGSWLMRAAVVRVTVHTCRRLLVGRDALLCDDRRCGLALRNGRAPLYRRARGGALRARQR